VRLLCDPNIDHGYLDALRRAEGITVTRVEDVLLMDASDKEIIAYAEEHDCVVFTSDQLFLYDDETGDPPYPRLPADCGVIFYNQIGKPGYGEVVVALREIEASYPEYSDIETYVSNWIGGNR
jgi:hypothetical protein